MNINFHYAAIKVVARYAGFSEEESQLIAYASQFVDDAVLHKPLVVDKDPGVPGIRFKAGEFDPICTAHRQIDYVTNMSNTKAHEHVYVCFHFVPGLEGRRDTSTYRRTQRDAAPARELVTDAIHAVKSHADGEARQRALIRLGVALHSYADTWAHQGFSGYRVSEDNDISRLEVLRKGRWGRAGLGSLFAAYAAPDLGHAGAGSLPDESDVEWGCRPGKPTPRRSNAREFLQAAERVFALLQQATGGRKRWALLQPLLDYCLRHPAGDVCSRESSWAREFPGVKFAYDEKEWFAAALAPKRETGNVLRDAVDPAPVTYQVRDDERYFHFHAAAKAQRDAVLARLHSDDS